MTVRSAWATLGLLTLAVTLIPSWPVSADLKAADPNGVSRIRGDQWHLRYLNVIEAHRISQGEGVVVAVPDTGVEPHPDLKRNLLPGKDLLSRGTGTKDLDSHGTSMAGLIAAHGQAASNGALGIAPMSKILPIRVKLKNDDGNPADLARGIEYAVSQHVDVLSISIASAPSVELRKAIDQALRADVVVVAGAGNRPREQAVAFPAIHPGVVAVGGIDESGNLSSVSATGPEIEITAPAEGIFSTSTDGNYSKGTGTSDSTAIVAGAVALIRSRYPDLPAEEVVHRLTATAVDKGPPGRDDQYGYGVLDLVAALTADVPPLGSEPTAPDASPTPPRPHQAQPRDGSAATTRGLVTLGVIVAAGASWAYIARRRRRGDDPPPRISR